MTEKQDSVANAGNQISHAAYSSVAPPSLAAFNSDLDASEPGFHYAGVTTMTGVDQTTPTGSVFVATGTNGTATVTVTGLTTDGLIVDGVISQGSSLTVGAGQTSNLAEADANSHRWASSTQSSNTAGGVMSWTVGAPDYWGTIALEYKPSGGAAAALDDAAFQIRARGLGRDPYVTVFS
jgi:hypothetical protein